MPELAVAAADEEEEEEDADLLATGAATKGTVGIINEGIRLPLRIGFVEIEYGVRIVDDCMIAMGDEIEGLTLMLGMNLRAAGLAADAAAAAAAALRLLRRRRPSAEPPAAAAEDAELESDELAACLVTTFVVVETTFDSLLAAAEEAAPAEEAPAALPIGPKGPMGLASPMAP